jgi:spoIIIJ-associated protein
VSLEGGAERARERVQVVIETIVAAAAVQAEVRVKRDERGLWAEIRGDDLGLVIGRHGQTIDAIQHIAQRIAFHGQDERLAVTVDAAGYRQRRAASLHAAAEQAAEIAVREGRAVALEPMGPHERRLVHEYLKARRDVETYSEGQEPARRLVVAPVRS